MDLKLLKQLCTLNGISGDEDRVAQWVLEQVKDHCESWSRDPLGNLLVFKRGRQRPQKKLLFSAHMDEVGMMVSHVTDEGMLGIVKVGGIDDRVILGRQVAVGRSAIPGVIGVKAIHQQTEKERKTAVKWDKMLIDIGCSAKEEAEKLAAPGDPVYFRSDFERLGETRVKGKAIDDRFGCAVMIGLIQEDLPYDCWFSFVTQEEVGLRGAAAAGYTLKPDVAVILEVTASGDMPGVSEPQSCCRLGGGVVIPFMDRGTLYPRELYQRCRALAAEHHIPTQTKTVIAGGNDAGAYQKAAGGVSCINLSVAGRCLHTPCVIADTEDMAAVEKLALLLAETLPAGE